ncbi:EAL domain-containing protein [Arthrobacter sp. OV608]|nr:EAL domain-containing protein [Arthrobacter sp. OV608]
MAPDRIVLELTERQRVNDYDSLVSALMPLRELGLRVAVDDAGSGFSSMRHILELRPDIIKLDRSVITGIHANPGQRALGAAMVKFAPEISATIVAEGIETEASASMPDKATSPAAPQPTSPTGLHGVYCRQGFRQA